MLYKFSNENRTIEIDEEDLKNVDVIVCYLVLVLVYKTKNRSKPPIMDPNDTPSDITDDKKRWFYILAEIEWTCDHICYQTNENNLIIKDNVLSLMKFEDRIQNGLRLISRYLREMSL